MTIIKPYICDSLGHSLNNINVNMKRDTIMCVNVCVCVCVECTCIYPILNIGKKVPFTLIGYLSTDFERISGHSCSVHREV